MRSQWRHAILVAGMFGFGISQEQEVGGSPGCLCLTLDQLPAPWLAQWQPNSTCRLVDGAAYTGRAGEPDYCYPTSYGVAQCEPHDQSRQPFCVDEEGAVRFDAPAWCTEAWCYVDQGTCDRGDATPTAFLVTGGTSADVPHYSYEACGIDSYYAKFRRAVLLNASDIVGVVEAYVEGLRDYMESQASIIQEAASAGEGNNGCQFVDGCACTDCELAGGSWRVPNAQPGDWQGYEVDYSTVTVVHRGDTSTNSDDERETQCLSALSRGEFQRIARLEYNDPDRLGWIFFGDQRSAVWFGWPGIDYCPTESAIYDPRFRPWYVSAVSGPKDMVIILDKSGSMQAQSGAGSRWDAAMVAAQEVLKTLNEADYAAVITFSSESNSFESQSQLLPATDANVERMRDWLGAEVPMGSTNFRTAFSRAFGIIDASVASGRTSGCNGMVLFLTDGIDSSSFSLTDLESFNTQNFVIFTYSFGDGADLSLPKDIACNHRGIWHHIPDGGDISGAMSNYFGYYAEMMSEHKQIRWSMYEEVSTQNDLVSGCLPVYDRTTEPHRLLGVVGLDVSIVIAIPELRNKPDWSTALQGMREVNERCFRASHSEEVLERLRSYVAHDAQCSVELRQYTSGSVSTANMAPSSMAQGIWLLLAVPLALLAGSPGGL